jgi:probable dihydroxyacetone kinase regulator
MERKESVRQTREGLADSFKALMRRKGFDRITVEEICHGAGMARRSFYRYFLDKHDLLSWIFRQEFFSQLDQYEDWNCWDYFYVICCFLYQDRPFYANAFVVSGQNSSREFCDQQMKPILRRDFQGTFQSQEEETFWLELILTQTYDQLVKWLQQEPCPSPEEFVRGMRDSQMRAVRRYVQICGKEPAPDRGEVAREMIAQQKKRRDERREER